MARERPILFSAPMVNAIWEGRKTQTRRVAKLTPAGHVKEPGGHRRWHPGDPDSSAACPYGQPGDRLYVRESFRAGVEWDDTKPSEIDPRCGGNQIRYEADGSAWEHSPHGSVCFGRMDVSYGWGKLRPGIFMLRWASRIDLEVKSVRVERLREISGADIIAEGAVSRSHDVEAYAMVGGDPKCPVSAFDGCVYPDLSSLWRAGWNAINAKRGYSWESNPWVWVVGFEVVTP